MQSIPLLEDYCSELMSLPHEAIDSVVRSTAVVTITMEDIFRDLDTDPRPVLYSCLQRQMAALKDALILLAHVGDRARPDDATVDTESLFENAWAGYSPAVFDHSVGLIERRLERNAIGAEFFAGKRCFDGGCGIGRFSIAMGKMGAAEVIAADIGQKSLDYAERQAARVGLSNLKPVRQDITDLSKWPDGSFDFVASYGVLHHTPDPIKGLREHFRILKSGGTLWLYLYGADGIYWSVYDRLRAVVGRYPVEDVKASLQRMNLREGLVYTYLDNVLAPRTYHYEDDIISTLRESDPGLTFVRAKGSSFIDDVDLCLASKYGREIVGPQGEVRLIIQKS